MRIALVYRNVNLSGSLERCVALLASELALEGVEVHCYCNPASSIDDIPGVRFHAVRPLVSSRRRIGYAVECASFAAAATRAIRATKRTFDIVDVVGPAGWHHDVVTVHGVVHAHQRRWPAEGGQDRPLAGLRALAAPVTAPVFAVGRGVERLQFRAGRFSRVIAVTERVADDVMRVHGVPSERIDIIPPPIDVARFAARNGSNVRSELGLAPSARLLLFVGHDFERKGLGDALTSLAGLDETVHLVVVGGADPTRHRRQAERLGVASRVHFVGRTDHPERYFHDADVLVLPTKNDPWGDVLVEAMAAGLPIVTSAVAGAAEVVRSHGAGVVIDDPSPTVLRAELRALLAAPDRMIRHAAAGRSAADEYSVERNAQATLATYERVLREKQGIRPVPRKVAPSPRTRRVATLPPLGGMNPYQRLLYEHLRPLGFELVSGARLRVSWLWAARPDVDLIHIHWPQALYTYAAGPKLLRPAMSWLKLAAFVLRLRVARRLGYRLVWTIHQAYPHDRAPSLRDRLAARSLARAADVLIAHDETTAESSRRELGSSASRIAVIPHGSYIGIYPPGRSRRDVRRELGVPDSAFTFLVFGELRAHKEITRVLEAFGTARVRDLALVIAGMPKDADTISALERYASEDARVRLKLEFVYTEHVAELFAACDAVIAPRTDGGTSGSLILGPSLGLPTIAANRPVYAEVIADGACGWLFEPDVPSLRAAIEEASADPEAARAKGIAGLDLMAGRSWDDVARRTAVLLEASGGHVSGIPGRRIVVLSPHLDDAVLSLGASIADAAATGADVAIVTAFAGDPARQGDSSAWDRRAGFNSSVEALEVRRQEDRLACAAIGARPVWLPFGYGGVEVDERELGKQLAEAVRDADTVLVPGWPLKNPEHGVLALLALHIGIKSPTLGLYVEQPYVWWRSYVEPGLLPQLAAVGIESPAWTALRATRAGRRAKRRALGAYRSQLKLLRGRRLSLPVVWRIGFYERRAGGEGVGWIAQAR